MALPKVTADEFREFYMENNRSVGIIKMLFIIPVVMCGIILMLMLLSFLNEKPISFSELETTLFGFKPLEISLLYLGLSAFVILRLDEILNFIWSDQKIRKKIAGDITFRPGKYSDYITLTEPLEKYTYICDHYFKIRAMTLIVISMIGCQLFLISMGTENIFKYLLIVPLLFTVYQMYMAKQSGTGGLFVFNRRIMPLIDRDH